MKIILRYLVITQLAILAACGELKKDTVYYLTHPEEVQAAYDFCVQSNKTNQPTSNQCRAVFQAIPVVQRYLTELINDPSQFGLQIMATQNELMKYQVQYRAVRNDQDPKTIRNLQAAIAEKQLELESRYAIKRMVSHPN